MLDYDLAEIYGYEVKRLNEQVKRNISRFPEDFMFQLTKEEVPEEFSKSQFATLNENEDKRGTNIKKLPHAFTEQGIYMLATVLRGELAEQQSIFIMRAFREMRHYIKTKSAVCYRIGNICTGCWAYRLEKENGLCWKSTNFMTYICIKICAF